MTEATVRRDAARNRERLLTAASELFAERGLNVTLNDIAHRAGVGVGTAYRRFANKEEVIDALFEQRLQDVIAVAEEALAAGDAWAGLVSFLERSLHMQFGDRGLTEIMISPQLGRERVNETRDRIAPLLTQLVDRAKKQRTIRSDFEQSDLFFMQMALAAIIDRARGPPPCPYPRHLAIGLDGIPRPPSDFPSPPTTALSA